MGKPLESEENRNLENVKQKIQDTIFEIDKNVISYAVDLHKNKEYLYDNKDGMDRMEKNAVRQTINQGAIVGEKAVVLKKRLSKLLLSPYFGRVYFKEKNKTDKYIIYIGLYLFFDNISQSNLIHDWRAPVSSMYYDFELGNASYEAPNGIIKGHITLKRQYKIRN
ncbi:MAG: helicase, partial [Bacteroidales bacterium]|nr:helicase [Bacteroidales bacterium]